MGQSMEMSRIGINKRYMALTFDDGSNPARTLSILNILSKYNVKSTFFLTGESVSAFPESAREILQYGHEIGNHSYSHPPLNQLSVATIKVEIKKCENYYKLATFVNNS